VAGKTPATRHRHRGLVVQWLVPVEAPALAVSLMSPQHAVHQLQVGLLSWQRLRRW
jgi:hypothetical protein